MGGQARRAWDWMNGNGPQKRQTTQQDFARWTTSQIVADLQFDTEYKVESINELKRNLTHPVMEAWIRFEITGPELGIGVLNVRFVHEVELREAKAAGVLARDLFVGAHQIIAGGYDFHATLYVNQSAGTHFCMVPRQRKVERDIIERAVELWQCYEAGERPPIDTDTARPPLPKVEGEVQQRTDDAFAHAAEELAIARDIRQRAERVEAGAKERVTLLLGDHYGAIEGGGYRVHRKMREGRTTTDTKALIKHRPVDAIRLAAVLLNEWGWSYEDASKLVDDTVLEIQDFQTQGKPFGEMRIYEL